MRIGIDLSVLAQQRTGIGNYAFNLVRALLDLKTEHEWVWFVSSGLTSPIPSSRGGETGEVVELPKKLLPFWSAHVTYARIMKKAKLDVLHGVANMVPLGFNLGKTSLRRITGALSPRQGRVIERMTRSVITLHDLAIYKHPEWFPRGQWLSTKLIVPRSIKKADKIIVPSEATKRDVMELFGVAESKIAVIPHGVEERFYSSSVIASGTPRGSPIEIALSSRLLVGTPRNDNNKDYILFVGTIEPRKNITRLIEAYQGLPEEIRKEYDLVIVGKPGHIPLAPPHFKGEGVRVLNYVRDDDLPGLYQNAALFVYPSLYEGFGLPVLEAMAAGVPVVTSKGTAMEEVTSPSPSSRGGACALLVDPYSVDQIRDAVAKLLTDPELRGVMGERGVMLAKGFSWGQTVQKTLEIYESV